MASEKTFVRLLRTATAEALSENVVAKSAGKNDGLYKRLSALAITGRSVEQTLNDYKMEGKVITKYELHHCIQELHRYGRLNPVRFNHALEVMEWMRRQKINFSHKDYAWYLNLIVKSKGIAAAEKYLSGLPPSAKNRYIYGSLLNCYCAELMTEKALALFEEMNQLNIVYSCAFDSLMFMCVKLGQPEKVSSLVKQMIQRNISLHSHTYIFWMQSYASLNDIDGVERAFEEMRRGGEDKCSWSAYSNLAVIYVKAELFEKAELALKKLKEMKPREREAYHHLISLYASTFNLEEVNQIWNFLKSSFPMTNKSYQVMLQALDKLNAINGLKECFKEWESSHCSYDIRLVNTVIRAYLKRDMYEEAVSVFDEGIKRSKGHFFKAREAFMVYYLRNCQLDLAWKEMESAISEAKEHDWKPLEGTINAFFRIFMEQKDIVRAEEFCRILKSFNCLNSNACFLLMRTYMAAGKLAPEVRQRLQENGIEMSHELEDLARKSVYV